MSDGTALLIDSKNGFKAKDQEILLYISLIFAILIQKKFSFKKLKS